MDNARCRRRRPWRDWRTALTGVLVLALALRLFGVDWDERRMLHPDERFIATVANDVRWPSSVGEYFDTGRSPLNPANLEPRATYAYGTLPLFAVKAAADALGVEGYENRALVGRVLGALVDTGTVLLVFLCGSLLLGRRGGLLAALLAALSVLPIQLAHFWTVDPWLAFFAAATLLMSLLALRDGRRRWLVAAGAAVGAGFACKASALLLPVVPLGAALLRLRRSGAPWPRGLAVAHRPEEPMRAAAGLLAGALAAVLVARLAQPYAFAGPRLWDLSLNRDFLDALAEQRHLLSGGAQWPPALAWAGRPRLLFPLQNLLGWGLGPALGVTVAIACGAALWRIVRGHDRWLAVPLLAAGAFVAAHGVGFVAYTRYSLPAVAPLCLLAAWLLCRLRARRRGPLLAWAVVVATAMWTVAFETIYARPHTRIEASAWIHANVPAGATLAVEEWDDALPLPMEGRPARGEAVRLPVLERDSKDKVRRLVNALAKADYVVLSSDRLREPIMRLPAAFPATRRYYQTLEDGSLGFRRVARFSRGPSLLGVPLPSLGAEESFSVYDHPTVSVYRKTQAFQFVRAQRLLSAADPEPAVAGAPALLGIPPPLQEPDEAARQRAGGTWRSLAPVQAGSSLPALMGWLIALQVCALIALPLVMIALRRLPSRGVALSKPLGLLVVAYPVWLGASIGAWPFSRASVVVCVALLCVGLAAVTWRNREHVRTALGAHWRQLLAAEGIFLVAFLAVYALRTGNPDLFHPFRGGEKSMDFAHLNAVVKSTVMPPYDPWFAGGYLNYYYFGTFLAAVPTKTLGIAPELAYNLAVATFAAFAAAAAYSLGYDLAGLSARHGTGGRRSPVLAGIGAVLLVMVAGNLDGAIQWVDRVQALDGWGLLQGTGPLGGLLAFFGGLWSMLAHGAELAPFDYWRASRVIEDSFAITEFPAFTVLLGDLHAHLAALPYAMAAASAALASLLHTSAGERLVRSLPALALCGLLIGALRATNTWDVPAQALGASLAVGTGAWLARGRLRQPWARTFLLRVAVIGAVGWLAFRPFDARFRRYYDELAVPRDATPPLDLIIHFGLPLLLVVALAVPGAALLQAIRTRPRARWLAAGVAAAALLALLAGRASLAIVVVLGALIALRAAVAGREEADLGLLAALGLALLGLATVAAAEVVRVEQDLERMNTVFKLWLHAWWLLGVAAAYTGWRMLARSPARSRGRSAWSAAVAMMAAAALLYPLYAVPARLKDRLIDTPATADAMAFMGKAVYADDRGTYRLARDLVAIRWARRHVRGSPVIIEAVTPLYRWGGRFSVYTGLPTVIGWDFHQKQQRGGSHAEIERRAREVETFYSTWDAAEALSILRRHDVRYVFVGTLERAYYPAAGLEKIELLPGLRRVFSRDGVIVYERRPEA